MQVSSGEDEAPIVGINVTPLVDVCLVLVIIFMVTAPMFSDPMFKVNLPKAHTQEGEEKDKIVVSISAEGKMAVGEKEVKDKQELTRELQYRISQSQDKYVVFKADQDALHGLLIELMYQAKEAGAKSLTVATEKKRE
ncbi:MAG: biopolymer transporter ExbD [Elusimicrobia bacterium]|nr:biopolymer transporter ExbD [Elusimicrobiota bacterium]